MTLLNLPPENENNLLRQVSTDVANGEIISAQTTQLLKAMEETMKYWKGIGLAAVQILTPKKIILVLSNEGEIYPLFNAKITQTSRTKDTLIEGCLSLPGCDVSVTRPVGVTVEYLNEKAEAKIKKVAGLEARILQHEIDHTNGLLITDHNVPLKRHQMG